MDLKPDPLKLGLDALFQFCELLLFSCFLQGEARTSGPSSFWESSGDAGFCSVGGWMGREPSSTSAML